MREEEEDNLSNTPQGGILGLSESDKQPLHTTPPWLPQHSGWSPLLSQVMEAPHPSFPSDLSWLPSLSLPFPAPYCPRTFACATPTGDYWPSAKVYPRPDLPTHLVLIISLELSRMMGRIISHEKKLIYPGPGKPSAPCTGPT